MTLLPIADIRTDGGTQSRVQLDWIAVSEYAAAMKDGAQFPPIVVFHDGSEYWLADGFHRLDAANKAGLDTIAADVRQGTKRDAVLYSVGANSSHGVRRTNADKRAAVLLLLGDEEWRENGFEWMARAAGVSAPFVSKVYYELSPNGLEMVKPAKRKVERNGVTYAMNTAAIGKPTTKPLLKPATVPAIIFPPTIDNPDPMPLPSPDAVREARAFMEARGLEVFTCPDCGDIFDQEVWHCPACHHHWLDGRDYCANCYSARPGVAVDDDNSETLPPAAENDWEYIKDPLPSFTSIGIGNPPPPVPWPDGYAPAPNPPDFEYEQPCPLCGDMAHAEHGGAGRFWWKCEACRYETDMVPEEWLAASWAETNEGKRPRHYWEPQVAIYNADAQQIHALGLPPVHLVVTSPPYNVGIDYDLHADDLSTYFELITSVWRQCFDVLVDGGRVAVVVPFGVGRNPWVPLASKVMDTLTAAGFTLRGQIIWDKNTSGNRTSWGSFRMATDPSLRDTTEAVIVAHKGSSGLAVPPEHKAHDEKGTFTPFLADSDYFMELAQDHWIVAPESAQRVKHPAPFPVELVKRLIHFYAFPGAHILDPFAGSGTTGVAARECGCRASLVELSADYCKIAETRCSN